MPSSSNGNTLRTLLSPAQRQELLYLLTAACATLRAHVIQIFLLEDPPKSAVSAHKAETLSSFDIWRATVLARVHEAIDPTPPKTSTIAEKTSNLFNPNALEKRTESAPSPPLKSLPEETKKKVLAALLLLLLSLHTYDARSRILLLDITRALELPTSALIDLESITAVGILEAAQHISDSKSEESSMTSKWGVGLATVAGATLIGVTGGLAAPLVAAGVSSVMGGLGLGTTAIATYLGTAASSSTIVGTLFGAYGARRSNEIAERYAADVSDFKLIRLAGEEEEKRMRIAIGVTGWIEKDAETEVGAPWKAFNEKAVAPYALRWETAILEDLGRAETSLLSDYATGWVKKQIISRTVFATLSAALWPTGLLKAAKVIDNPFANALRMSRKTGAVLALSLLERAQGERPVTLVGFSLGGRVVWECCRELSRKKGYGILENVIIIGAPVPADTESWREVRSIVAGRVVNVYAEQDWILAFLYRAANLQLGVAGLQKVEAHGVENLNVAERVSGHLKYPYEIPYIIKEILGEDVDFDEVDVPKQTREDGTAHLYAANEEEFGKKVETANKELKERQEAREEKARESSMDEK